MGNGNSNKEAEDLTQEQAEAWLFTLFLGFVICFGLAIYTLITHNLIFDYPDPTLFKPNLTWLGFTGICLYFSTFIIFWIGSAYVRYLPDKIPRSNIAVIVGIILFLISFIILGFSYDLSNRRLHYIGFTCEATGLTISMTKEIMEYKFGIRVARFWFLLGIIIIFTGLICLAYSFDN